MFRQFSLALIALSALTILADSGLDRAMAKDDSASASDAIWTLIDAIPAERAAAGQPWVRPERYQAVEVDLALARNVLQAAPLEADVGLRMSPFVFSMPMPDGTFMRFRVVESPIMAPELARKYPEIRTYLGQGVDDPYTSTRFDVTPAGFHAQIISPNGWVYIDPYTQGDTTLHTSYYRRDLLPRDQLSCELGPHLEAEVDNFIMPDGTRTSGNTRREYATAIGATGEYTAFHGGTVAAGMAAIVTAMNRVTQIYELENTIRFILVANNDLIVYTDGATDPYTNGNTNSLISQNQTTCDGVIGSANYGIGHCFDRHPTAGTGSGLAQLGVVCTAGSKARGASSVNSPTGDFFYVDFVCHEMGHQFNAGHTFNGVNGSCGLAGQWSSSNAYEPGSGSTIMSYAGACGAIDNIQTSSDPYFHSQSHFSINAYASAPARTCDSEVATGNSIPTVDAGPNYTIPQFTPFILTPASYSDADGDPLTFCWEERDLGPQQAANQPDNGSSPLFRSRLATTSPSRMLPALTAVLFNQYNNKGDRLPTTNRTMTFRCTVRDNRAGGGGVNHDDMQVTCTTSAGPFTVTFPNTAGTHSGNITVTWNVANTNLSPVNCANVSILLSTDGGSNFPTVLAASTPNDGSEVVTLPNISTTQARIRVAAVGNIFFDQSNANFTITPAAPAAPTNAQATPGPICNGDSSDLSVDPVGAPLVIDWFTGSCGGTLVNTGNPISVSPGVTTTYYARTRDTGTGLSSATCASVMLVVYVAGDANGDTLIDVNDVDPFATILLNAPSGQDCAADMDNDGDADGDDIGLFTDLLVP